jgi:two-component system, cell cycle sensor histidine kinase and response regulator CckA
MDTSESKHLEEQLRRRAEELEKLMELAPVALFVAHDPQCHEITGNLAAKAMLEAVGNLSVTPEREAPVLARYFKDGIEVPPKELPMQVAARTGFEVRNCELEALLPSGTRKSLCGDAIPLRGADGQVRGAVGAFRDITLSKQRTDAALHETEERFSKLADTAPVIMWLKDTNHRITFVNRSAVEFFGLSTEQLISDGLAQAIHPDDVASARAVYYEASDRRASCQAEFRARRADGEYRHMLGTSGPRYVGGIYVGQAGTIVDVTDLKRRQDADLARQKLESLGTLAGGIAHDFNNLLGAIVAQTELALGELANGAPAEGEMRTIASVAMRGAEIVRQLIAYAGEKETALEPVNISRLIEDSLELLKVVVSKHAALRLHLASDGLAVRANPGTIRQILINLVTNASEAIGQRDGVIQVHVSRATIQPYLQAAADALPAGDYVQLEISDTGCGIALENQSKIFDPFFSMKSPGRGLGLSVVQGIVKRLGGTITVSSAVGEGSAFQILLPVAGDPIADCHRSQGHAEETRRAVSGAILLVDDEESIRRAVSRMLEKEGFTVLNAAAGSEAMEILGIHGTALTAMILDATLPGIPSPEILREARRLRPDMRVIVTSAYSEQKVASMFSRPEGQLFLLKPYLLADVLKLLS